jgi:hypothetical protein
LIGCMQLCHIVATRAPDTLVRRAKIPLSPQPEMTMRG